jgi:hypothetical protein
MSRAEERFDCDGEAEYYSMKPGPIRILAHLGQHDNRAGNLGGFSVSCLQSHFGPLLGPPSARGPSSIYISYKNEEKERVL